MISIDWHQRTYKRAKLRPYIRSLLASRLYELHQSIKYEGLKASSLEWIHTAFLHIYF